MFGTGYKNVYSLAASELLELPHSPPEDVCVCESLSCWRFDTLVLPAGAEILPPPQDALQQLPGLVGFTERRVRLYL